MRMGPSRIDVGIQNQFTHSKKDKDRCGSRLRGGARLGTTPRPYRESIFSGIRHRTKRPVLLCSYLGLSALPSLNLVFATPQEPPGAPLRSGSTFMTSSSPG